MTEIIKENIEIIKKASLDNWDFLIIIESQRESKGIASLGFKIMGAK